eukprot:2149189-Alexandrium_andersonii.AAC.1
MSASLVGSEMCIRDSACGPRLGGRTRSGAPLGPGTAESALEGPARLLVCLLYTSDAADDM